MIGKYITIPTSFEFILLRLPVSMAGSQTAISSQWTPPSASAGSDTDTYYHPCIYLRSTENLSNRLALDIEIFVIRAFGNNFQVASEYIKSSPDRALFLPIPTTNKTPSTPPAFGRPLDAPGFIAKLPSWALARQIGIMVQKIPKW